MLEQQGDVDAAETHFRESLAMYRRLFGDGHPHVAGSLRGLAGLLQGKGDYEAAERLLVEALSMDRRLLGEEHSAVAENLHGLAALLREKGDYDGAEHQYRKALAIFRSQLGNEHPFLGVSLVSLANLRIDRGDFEGAETLIDESLDIFRRALPPDHWWKVQAESVRGACLSGLGRFAEAEPLLLDSYPVLKERQGVESTYAKDALKRIVDLYEAWGKPAKAAEYRALTPEPDRPES